MNYFVKIVPIFDLNVFPFCRYPCKQRIRILSPVSMSVLFCGCSFCFDELMINLTEYSKIYDFCTDYENRL